MLEHRLLSSSTTFRAEVGAVMLDAELALDRAAALVLDPQDSWASSYWTVHRRRLLDDLYLLAGYPGRILEVGSAPFITTLALGLADRDVTGVDIEPSRAPAEVNVVACDIEREPLPVPDDSFDVVLFSEVFEHLRIDPLFTIGELKRVLRPGGTLLLTTPNLRSLRGILRLVLLGKGWAVGAYPAREYAFLREKGWMGHVREYTAYEVAGVLETCGFAVAEIVWRKKPGALAWRAVEAVVPPLRPYMTLVAR